MKIYAHLNPFPPPFHSRAVLVITRDIDISKYGVHTIHKGGGGKLLEGEKGKPI